MEQVLQDASNLAPPGAAFLVVMALLTFALPRTFAMIPMLATVCYMPLGQQLVIGGLHFTIMRSLIFVGVVRVLCRGEARGLVRNRIDKIFVWWAVLSVILGLLSDPSSKVLINRLGAFYNAVGIYFLACCWIRDFKTFMNSVKYLAVLSVPVAILMLVEKFTMHNIFSVFGGVPEITGLRDGHLRCQAAFRTPILAGTFGATSLPLFVGLWVQERKARLIAAAGVLSACIIAVAASSGGALLTLVLGIISFGFWRMRNQMKLVRRATVAILLGLAILMQAPVWYLTSRLSSIVGGTGWHRSWLMDVTVAHFGEWWLCGTTYTAHWGGPGFVLDDDPDNIDITSQYITEAVKGGLLKLVLFMAIIVQCFKVLGRRIHEDPPQTETVPLMWWAIGVCLFTHCVSFWSIPYFDQMAVIWYWLLASIARIAFNEPQLVPLPIADGIEGVPSQYNFETSEFTA